MRKILTVLLTGALGLGSLVGCTMAETRSEHSQRVGNIMQMDLRAASEDLDYIFLVDRNSRLTKWHSRIEN